MPAPSPIPFNPFPGLRPFQMEEEYLFFGRETQRRELLALLRENRFVAVLGASGSGKSSLVRAGLLPALFGGVMTKAGSHWNVALMRPGGRPIANLAGALLNAELWSGGPAPSPLELETTLSRSGLGLVEAVRQARRPQDQNLLVVVDQFEELFRFSASQSERSTRDEAAAFVSLLLEAARQDQISIYLVLTMRSDFFGDCSQFEDLAEAINQGEYLVPRLTREQKKQAIEGPIKVGGGRIAPRLLQRLLNDVGDDPDQLPILQHALMRSWDGWAVDHAGDEPLDLRHYEGIGGMREALSRHADEVYAALPDDGHRLVAERIFKALTERGSDNRGIRRPTRANQLSAITGVADAEARAVIQAFRKAGRTFLMPPEQVDLTADTVVDISHESLMRVWQRLRHWVEEEAQSARIYGRLAETASLHAEGKAGLYHDPDLQIALSWREVTQPNEAWARRYHPAFDAAIAFLEQSADAKRADAEAREIARRKELEQAKALAETERQRAEEQIRFAARLKWLVRGLGLVAMVALTAFASAWLARQEARRQAQFAEENRESAVRNAAKATEQARIAEQQRGVADRMRGESQQLADALKSTLTRADFIAGSEQLEAGKVSRALSFLARSMRTDPTYAPAAFQTIQALSEHTLPLQPPVLLRQNQPIQWWSMNETKDVIWTVDTERYGFLWRVSTGEKIAPLAEGKQVDRVHFTRDGKRVFTAVPGDGEIRGWEAHTGKAAAAPLKPGYGFGDYFVSAGTDQTYFLLVQNGDGSLQLHDATKGVPISPRLKTNGKVVRFGLSPDGQFAYGDFDDRALGIWKTTNGEPALPPVRHNLAVSEARFSPNGRFLLLSSEGDRKLQWWDVTALSAPARTLETPHPIRGFRFNREGSQVVVTSWPNARESAALLIQVLDLATGREIARSEEPKLTLRNQRNPVANLTWAGFDAARGAVAHWVLGGVVDQRTFKVWDLHSGKTITELPLQEAPIREVEFSPDGGRIALLLENRQVRIWDAFTAKPVSEPVENKGDIESMFFSPEGEKLFLVFNESGAWLYTRDARTGKLLLEPFKIAQGFVHDPTPTRDRNLLAIFGEASTFSPGEGWRQTEGEISLWRAQPGGAFHLGLALPAPVLHAEFSPDGKQLLAANSLGDRSEVYVWETSTRRLTAKLRHPGGIPFASFSPDGRHILTACNDHLARLWTLPAGEVVAKMSHQANLWRVYFSPDGRLALTLTTDGHAQVWNPLRGQPLFDPIKVAVFIYHAAWSPDGARFALASQSDRVRVFETQTGKELFDESRLNKPASDVSFSSDGEVLLATGWQQPLRVWNARTGELIRELPEKLFSHRHALHPTRSVLATGSGQNDAQDGAVHLWDWQEGRLLGEPLPIFGRAVEVAFSPDGAWVASVTAPGDMKMWDVGTGKLLWHSTERQVPNRYSGVALNFSPDGRYLMAAYNYGLVDLIPLPQPGGQIPESLPLLAEAVAGNSLNEQGGLEQVAPERLKGLRESLSESASSDSFTRWAKWFFADRQTRPVSPDANLTVPDYALKLALDDAPLTNRFRALQLAPNSGVAYARLALDLAISQLRTNSTAQATNLWNSSITWYADESTNLAPESAEVWALRAGTLLTVGQQDQAAQAVARAQALDARNPNVCYFDALSRAAGGQREEAFQAFVKALELLPRKESDLHWQSQLLKPYLRGALRALMDLEIVNPLELARLGRRRLDDESDSTDRKYWEARWLTKRATELLPQDAEIWRLRSEVLLAADEEEESLLALKKAADVDASGQPDPHHYGAWLRSTIELLDRAGRYEESRAFALRRGIPPRPVAAQPIHVDLTRHYNVSLWEDAHRAKGRSHAGGNWWEHLPKGLATLAGVQFDLRGEIQLNGRGLVQGSGSQSGAWAITYPQAVTGIAVGGKAQWIHFLHSAGWGGDLKAGTIVGRYRLHYADGITHEIPMVAGNDLAEWRNNPFFRPTRGQLAWNEYSGGVHKTIYLSTWENPRPGAEIVNLDVSSDMTLAAPRIFAITLENAKEDDALQALPALALAQDALAKVTRVQGLNEPGRAYAEKLSRLALAKAPEDLAIQRHRAEVLIRCGKSDEAKPLVEALLKSNPNDHGAWNLKALLRGNAGQNAAAIEATQQALDRLPAGAEESNERRKQYVQTAVDLFNAEGKMGDARQFFVRANIPARAAQATGYQVDLSPHYNGAFAEPWFQRPNEAEFAASLRTFPKGLTTLQGVEFDARGVVQINDRGRTFVHEFPNGVTGIRVGFKGDLVHFLQACSLNPPVGAIVARYRVHFANGQTRDVPVAFGRDIANFYQPPDRVEPANLAWRAEKAWAEPVDAAVFLSTWENPLPEVEITHLDFVSELTEAQPFVLAVTVEPFKTDAELTHLPPRQLAEWAFHRANPKQHPSTRVLDSARRLSAKAIKSEANDAEVWRLRAEFLHRVGEEAEALSAVEKSLELQSEGSNAWRLKVELLRKLKRFDAAAAARKEERRCELREKLPVRNPQARASQVDLSAYYNVALTEAIHGLQGFPANASENFSQLPHGLQFMAGVEFDVRGLINLTSANAEKSALRLSYPRSVQDIKVAQRARKVHFLHGAGWVRTDPAGTVVGKYVVHFVNGEQREIPITLGADVYDWHLSTARSNQPSSPQSKLAWRGKSGIGQDQELGLYLKTWDNPLPEVEMSYLDFVSEMGEANPFLVAITVE